MKRTKQETWFCYFCFFFFCFCSLFSETIAPLCSFYLSFSFFFCFKNVPAHWKAPIIWKDIVITTPATPGCKLFLNNIVIAAAKKTTKLPKRSRRYPAHLKQKSYVQKGNVKKFFIRNSSFPFLVPSFSPFHFPRVLTFCFLSFSLFSFRNFLSKAKEVPSFS